MRSLLRTLLIAATALLPGAALAQQPYSASTQTGAAPVADAAPIASSVEFDDGSHSYELLYSLVPSTFLSDSVAASYGITRANNRALINVSLREKLSGDAADESREQSARISGSYSDLIQKKPLEFREVREQGAIYYIAEFRHGDRETLRFDLAVTPANGSAEQRVSFTRTLYVDQ